MMRLAKGMPLKKNHIVKELRLPRVQIDRLSAGKVAYYAVPCLVCASFATAGLSRTP